MKKITDQSGLLGIFLCPVLAVQESHSLCRLLMDGRHYSQFTEAVNSKLDRLRLFVVTWLAAELKKCSYFLSFSFFSEACCIYPFFAHFQSVLEPAVPKFCCCFLEGGNLQLNREKDCTCQISAQLLRHF